MNIKEYISSGIIESYLLGHLSHAERAEVEAMAMKHPEVKAEIELVEETLMDIATKTPPPAHLKQSILSKIEVKEAKVVPLETKKSSSMLWLVAASVALLIGSSIYNIILMNRLKSTQDQLANVSNERDKYVNRYQDMAEWVPSIMNPENKKVTLKGMELAPNAMAAVYWNPKTKDVFLTLGSLPMPADDKQYQLWAIVDGKPVDAGVFNINENILNNINLQTMKSIAGAQAFAVTLEKKGGSPTPTMTAMYLMGNV